MPSDNSRRKSTNSGTWLSDEDERLIEAVGRHGTRWVLVAADVGTRTGDQCSKRWNENLNPKLDHSAWSPEEEQKLANCVNVHGHNWKFISDNFFETRAPLTLKNRYSLLTRRTKRGRPPLYSPQVPNSYSAGSSQIDSFFDPSLGSTSPSPGLLPTNQAGQPQMPGYGYLDFTAFPGTGSENDPASLPRTLDQQHPVWPHGSFDGTINPLSNTGVNLPMTDPSLGPNLAYDSAVWPNITGSQTDWMWPGSSAKPDEASEPEGVEYSVTCQRGRIRTVVNSLVDAAMSSAEGSETDDPVTLKLHVKV